jgi:hypothetical protein
MRQEEETLVVDRPHKWRGTTGKALKVWQRAGGTIRVERLDPKGWFSWEPACTLTHFIAANPNLKDFQTGRAK